MRLNLHEQIALVLSLLRWSALGCGVGLLAGASSAAFLAGLEWATRTRMEAPWLLWLLPAAGAAIGWVYARFGRDVEGGNNLLLERIHRAEGDVSWRMAPLIALGTIGTHLFGGSAGREGTAVQMGGSLADSLGRLVRLDPRDRRILLMSGISGGFGAVFGTPLAGTIFGLEVLAVGRIRYDALAPCFVASTVGDLACQWLGIGHHSYHVAVAPAVTPALLAWTALAGVCFGAASLAFAELTHAVQHLAKALVGRAWLRPALGGAAVIALTLAVGTRDYLGLGLPLIERSFEPGGVVAWAFALKIVFTAVTLGTGFKGGEVTPLFCIGATLGHAFAGLTGQPAPAFAALGFVAVFAGAANTPLACVLMGIELFGAPLAVPLTLACIVSYVTSGHRGIYMSQQIDTPKASRVVVADGLSLRDARSGSLSVEPFWMRPLPGREDEATPSRGGGGMSEESTFGARPFGQLRIFLRSGERPKAGGWRGRLSNPPFSHLILQRARDFGLAHGTVKHCVSGFVDRGQVQHEHAEYGNARLPIYVELHGSRESLERFCLESPELLAGRMIVYKDVERWGWHDGVFEEAALDGPNDAGGETA